MAKIKGLAVTKLQGRLGNMVFRNRGGENIVSERPANVKNPRTEAQQVQRAILNTVVQAYSVTKQITDHSFEGYTYGARNMERFMKVNLDMLRNDQPNRKLIFKGNNSVAPYGFVVSDGSLPSIPITARGVDGILDLPAIGVTSSSVTLQQFMSALNAEPGDQITFVYVVAPDSSVLVVGPGNSTQYGKCELAVARIVFKLNYTETELTTARASWAALSALFESSENLDILSVTLSDNSIIFEFAPDGSPLLGTAILSRKINSSWQRSRQDFKNVGLTEDEVKSYNQAIALPTYDPSSPYYLNNAES